MATTATYTAEWGQRVLSATSVDELNALWEEAVSKGFNNRASYILVQQNQANLRRVNQVLKETATRALAPLDTLTQDGAAVLFRSTVPGLIDEFGNVNAQIAKSYYQAQKLVNINTVRIESSALKPSSRGKLTNRMADRRATAELKAQLTVNSGYEVKLPKFDVTSKADTIVNYAMQQFQRTGAGATPEITNALTRAVASYNRDTILFNSALDKSVVGVQRVAEANACDFCQMVALDRHGSARVS